MASYGKQQEASLRNWPLLQCLSEFLYASAAEVGFVQKIEVVFMRQRGLNNSEVVHKAYLKDNEKSPCVAGTPSPAP
jgi:hypothetical protein